MADQFIVYQTGKYDYISFIHKGIEHALTDADVVDYPELVDYQTSEHSIRSHIHKRILNDIQSKELVETEYYFHSQQFISFDSLRIAIITPENSFEKYTGSIDLDYLIISSNPELEMDKLLQMYKSKNIIIAPSNAPWNIKKWSPAMEQSGIPVYYVKEEGAFVLSIE